MIRKLGFWPVLGLVVGSQVGTSILVLPSSLAPFGFLAFIGWGVASLGALILALVFAILCANFPQTGGPHVYVREAIGKNAAFFVGWTYWVISWVSSAMVVISAIRYLSPFLGSSDPLIELMLQILLVIIIMAVNLKGVVTAGRVELILAALKFLPLVIVPTIALTDFKIEHFLLDNKIKEMPISDILSQLILLTFWGFIGVESATTQAGSVVNAEKTIPKAIIVGTLLVALLYLINSVAIIGLLPNSALKATSAPYALASKVMFGGSWYLLISLIASIICIGTLNAWVLTSGQIALGLAQDGLLPNLFAKKNSNNAPYWAVIISSLGVIPILILTTDSGLDNQITQIIDFSVIGFLFVYLACALSFLILLYKRPSFVLWHWMIAILAIIFCGWVIYSTPFTPIIIASSFTLSGLPLYLLWYKKLFSSCKLSQL